MIIKSLPIFLFVREGRDWEIQDDLQKFACLSVCLFFSFWGGGREEYKMNIKILPVFSVCQPIRHLRMLLKAVTSRYCSTASKLTLFSSSLPSWFLHKFTPTVVKYLFCCCEIQLQRYMNEFGFLGVHFSVMMGRLRTTEWTSVLHLCSFYFSETNCPFVAVTCFVVGLYSFVMSNVITSNLSVYLSLVSN